jgi:hypothetical protein
MPIDPNVQAMASKMTAARGGRPMPMQGAPPQQPAEQEGPQEDQVLVQVKMLLTKALQLLGAAEGQ